VAGFVFRAYAGNAYSERSRLFGKWEGKFAATDFPVPDVEKGRRKLA
jgi:hypothetical protein